MINMKKPHNNITPDNEEAVEASQEKDDKAKSEIPEKADSQDVSEGIEAKLEALEKEARETYDRFLRVSAEFENYKKRAAREMDEFRKFANESLIRDLLPIVDNLERALETSASNNGISDRMAEGVDLTLKEILKVFEKFSVIPIEALGETFDPAFHEAVMQEEADTEPENIVLKELQKGYMIHDRLLRPSMVVVSKSAEVKKA